jgi:hypothetical protein
MNRACFSKNANLHSQKQHARCTRLIKSNFVRVKTSLVFTFLIVAILCDAQTPSNSDGLDKKVQVLLKQMTLEKKAMSSSGKGLWITKPIERLKIRSIWMTDGPCGLRKSVDGNALQFLCGGVNQAPYVIIHDKSKSWKLSKYNYLKADITNTGKEDIIAEISVDANGWTRQTDL